MGTGRTAGLPGDSPSYLRSSLYGRLQLGYARRQGGVDPPALPVRIALLVELPAQVLDLVLKAPVVAVVLVARLVASMSLLPVVVAILLKTPRRPLEGILARLTGDGLPVQDVPVQQWAYLPTFSLSSLLSPCLQSYSFLLSFPSPSRGTSR